MAMATTTQGAATEASKTSRALLAQMRCGMNYFPRRRIYEASTRREDLDKKRGGGASPRSVSLLFFPLGFSVVSAGECGCASRVSRWGRGAGGRPGSLGPARSGGAGAASTRIGDVAREGVPPPARARQPRSVFVCFCPGLRWLLDSDGNDRDGLRFGPLFFFQKNK